jgi:hypothetical protein
MGWKVMLEGFESEARRACAEEVEASPKMMEAPERCRRRMVEAPMPLAPPGMGL